MPNIMVRILRPIDNAAEKEYIKEFFRFVGCFISDCAVESRSSTGWSKMLIPEAEPNAVDVVINCYEEDPYRQECQQLGIKRIYCYFDFGEVISQVTDSPLRNKPVGMATKAVARQKILTDLIDAIWSDENQANLRKIANTYLNTKHGELFYFLQSKRCLRVLTMGEVLKDPNAQVARIPLHSYIERSVSALWEVYVRLEKCMDVYSIYARMNAANMIREIVFKLYDSERTQLRHIEYDGIQLSISRPNDLTQELTDLLTQDPQFVSAYLLMANVYKLSSAPDDTEARCYKKMLETVPNKSKGHAFVWYRSAYYYEKKLMDMDTALKHYQEAVRLNPDCYQALFKLGYYAAAEKHFNEAEDLLNRAIKVIFRGRSTDPDENGEYQNWLSLSLKDSQYVYKAYMLLAKIALNRNQEYAIKSSVGRACMAATKFDIATLVRHISDLGDSQFNMFMQYHQLSTPVWAMWQLLYPWSEDIIQDYYVRDIVRQKLKRWTRLEK